MRVVLFLFFIIFIGCKSSSQQGVHNINSEINSKEIKELITIANKHIANKLPGFYKVFFSVEYSDYKILINREEIQPCYHKVENYPLKPFFKTEKSNFKIYYYASFLKSKTDIITECDKDYKVTSFREKSFTLLSVCKSNMKNIAVANGVNVDKLFKETKRMLCD